MVGTRGLVCIGTYTTQSWCAVVVSVVFGLGYVLYYYERVCCSRSSIVRFQIPCLVETFDGRYYCNYKHYYSTIILLSYC